MAIRDRLWPGAALILAACLPEPSSKGAIDVEIVLDTAALPVGAAVGLFKAEAGTAGLSASDELLDSAFAASTITFRLPERVDESDVLSLDDDAHFEAAIYVPALWVDDGNLARDGEEPFLGTGFHWVVHAVSLPESLEGLGFVTGWNQAEVALTDTGTLTVLGPGEGPIALGPTLALRSSITLVGQAPGVAPGTTRLGVVPTTHAVFDDAEENVEPFHTQELEEGWTLVLEGTPPPDHFVEAKATEVLFSYRDNGDDVLDGADRKLASWKAVCDGDQRPVRAVYCLEPTALDVALAYDALAIPAGWSPVRFVDDGGTTPEVLPEGEWNHLSTASGCEDL